MLKVARVKPAVWAVYAVILQQDAPVVCPALVAELMLAA